MGDRFTRGFIAGILGNIPSVIINYVSYYLLHYSTNLFRHYVSTFIYGRIASYALEKVVSQAGQFLFMGLLGIILSYLLSWTGGDYRYVKGAVFGAASWLLLYTTGTILRLEPLWHVKAPTTLTHLAASVAYGLTTAYVLKLLNRQVAA